MSGAPKLAREEGVMKGFYSGFGPILFKQVPHTMAKFAVQGAAAEAITKSSGINWRPPPAAPRWALPLVGCDRWCGRCHHLAPADTLLSLVNKEGAGGTGSITSRLINIAKEIAFAKLALSACRRVAS